MTSPPTSQSSCPGQSSWQASGSDGRKVNLPKHSSITVSIIFTDPKAIDALLRISEVLEDLVEDMPWRTELAEAIEAASYAVENIKVVQVKE